MQTYSLNVPQKVKDEIPNKQEYYQVIRELGEKFMYENMEKYPDGKISYKLEKKTFQKQS